jgi:hypothetical protein
LDILIFVEDDIGDVNPDLPTERSDCPLKASTQPCLTSDGALPSGKLGSRFRTGGFRASDWPKLPSCLANPTAAFDLQFRPFRRHRRLAESRHFRCTRLSARSGRAWTGGFQPVSSIGHTNQEPHRLDLTRTGAWMPVTKCRQFSPGADVRQSGDGVQISLTWPALKAAERIACSNRLKSLCRQGATNAGSRARIAIPGSVRI